MGPDHIENHSVNKQPTKSELQLENDLGINFQRVPEGIYPGKGYVTAKELIKSGVIQYTHHHTLWLYRKGLISGYQIAGSIIFDAEGVEKLLQHQQESLEVNAHSGGRKHGSHHNRSGIK